MAPFSLRVPGEARMRSLKDNATIGVLAIAVGVMAGNVCAAFLFGLSYVTEARLDDPRFIWACPLLGLAVGLLVKFVARGEDTSVNAVIASVHDPTRVSSVRAGATLFFASLLTHLGGGSAGREGVGVFLGGVSAAIVARVSRTGPELSRILMVAGLAAGFTGTFGTPLAGLVFALEVVSFGRVSYDALLAVTAAAVASLLTTRLWPIQHGVLPVGDIPLLDAASAGHALMAGVVFGAAGLLFLWLLRAFGELARRAVPWDWARPAVGGLIIVGVFALTNSQTYLGLGLGILEESFNTPLPWFTSFAKSLLTAVTLGFGLKGGEVTPLFIVGSTLGNALETFVSLPFPLLAAMGLVAVLSGVTSTPLAGVVLGMELFGSEAGIFCALACVGSYLMVGRRGLFPAQSVVDPLAAGEGRGVRDAGLRTL